MGGAKGSMVSIQFGMEIGGWVRKWMPNEIQFIKYSHKCWLKGCPELKVNKKGKRKKKKISWSVFSCKFIYTYV